MDDLGAERLLIAIYAQAQTDLEDFYGRVRQHQLNCQKGKKLPVTFTYDDVTAVMWHKEKKRSKEIREMVDTCKNYIDRCQKCAGGGLDVQREGA
jgi:UPF0288 family protein (methanogenesis marker protein 3)